jgi:hypothetical protein
VADVSIPTVEDGQVVPGPGIYRMSMAHYHSQACCPGPSISSSGLRTIWGASPYHFWMQSALNPDRLPEKEESPALALGKGAHALMLGEERFDEMFAYLTDDAPRKPTAQQIKAYDEGRATEVGTNGVEFWRAFEERTAGKTVLTQDMVEKIRLMSQSLASNPAAVQALTGALTEVSLIWQDEATGVWLKSRVDVMPDAQFDYADLKTFAPQTRDIKRAIHRSITDYRYDMQMALGQEGAFQLTGAMPAEAVLVMLQSTEPYTCSVVRLDEEALYWGRVCNRQAIDTFARCLESGDWPQPVPGILEYTTPPSLQHRFGEMQAMGDLPNLER